MAKNNSTGEVLSNRGTTQATAPDSGALMDFSARVWAVHNILAFMAAAVDDDSGDGLPVQCTLLEMRDTLSTLAQDLSVASDALSRAERVSV